jgi:ArsR family transcriptional regulator, virulence genes transcriptional regulator
MDAMPEIMTDNTMGTSLLNMAEEASSLLVAMANPRRLMIMCHLLEGERSVGDLARLVSLSQSALSQHLGKLRTLKLVSTRRDAQTIYYRLSSPEAQRVLGVLNEIYCSRAGQASAQ